ncbi:MAG: hypothetical protein NT133_03780 [Alphaproteobacteria bacterium]|nr:hypothetical protein [Alphaproteobacteria bacterium]
MTFLAKARGFASLSVLAVLALPLAAPARGGETPSFAYQGGARLSFEHFDPTTNGLVARARVDAAAILSPNFAVIGAVRLLPITNTTAPANGVFAKEGLLADELFSQWREGGFTVRAGKFSPNFARGWLLAPGYFGDTFAGDAQILEQLGVEVSYAVPTERWGTQALSIADTVADRSPLAQTHLTARTPLRLRDGGPSNTVAPRSLTLAYDAAAIPLAGGSVSVHAGLANLARGQGDDAAEQLAVLAAYGGFQLPGDTGTLRPLAEFVRRWNADGHRGITDILTVGLAWETAEWTPSLAAGTRTARLSGQPTAHDRFAQISLARRIDADWSVAGGYMLERVGSVRVHAVGLELRRAFGNCGDCRIFSGRYY